MPPNGNQEALSPLLSLRNTLTGPHLNVLPLLSALTIDEENPWADQVPPDGVEVYGKGMLETFKFSGPPHTYDRKAFADPDRVSRSLLHDFTPPDSWVSLCNVATHRS